MYPTFQESFLPSANTRCVQQPGGVVKATNPLGKASDAEKKLLEVAIAGLKGNISKGVEFAQASSAKL